VDAIIVLAPDNIGEHLKLCSVALPTGKPTVIDKFLAPNLHDAREIVDNAKRHGTPFFSSSSLRYAVELEELMPQIKAANAESCYVRGMGNWSGYGIHTLAPALRMMGHGVKRVIDTGIPGASAITLDYGDRRANLEVREAKNGYEFFSWTFGAKVGDSYVGGTVKKYDEFYANLMKHSAGFFKTGKVDMPMEEALAAVAILEAGEKSKGEWVKVG
jgi:predicted dehydrogenase